MAWAKTNSTTGLAAAAVMSEPSVVSGARWLSTDLVSRFRSKTVPAALARGALPAR
jgi:hypothetical protein